MKLIYAIVRNDNEDDVKYILSEEGRKAVIKTHIDGITNYIKDTF